MVFLLFFFFKIDISYLLNDVDLKFIIINYFCLLVDFIKGDILFLYKDFVLLKLIILNMIF